MTMGDSFEEPEGDHSCWVGKVVRVRGQESHEFCGTVTDYNSELGEYKVHCANGEESWQKQDNFHLMEKKEGDSQEITATTMTSPITKRRRKELERVDMGDIRQEKKKKRQKISTDNKKKQVCHDSDSDIGLASDGEGHQGSSHEKEEGEKEIQLPKLRKRKSSSVVPETLKKNIISEEKEKMQEIKLKIPAYHPPEAVLQCKKCSKLIIVDPNEFLIMPAPGDKNYIFKCGECNGKPKLDHQAKTWTEVALTAIYNLELLHQRQFFHSKLEICEFVDKNWSSLCVGKTRTVTWWATLHAQITQNKHLFKTLSYGSGYWGICHENESSAPLLKPMRKYKDRSPKKENDKTDCRVDKILDRRKHKGRIQYLLKWQGFSDSENSWEETDRVLSCPDLVEQFEIEYKQIKKEKRTQKKRPMDDDKVTEDGDSCERDENGYGLDDKKKHKTKNDKETKTARVTCHQCRNKRPNLISCSSGKCTKRFCENCLTNHYHLNVEEIVTSGTWICVQCTGQCTCISCKRHRGEIPKASQNGTPKTTPKKRTKDSLSEGEFTVERIMAKSVKNNRRKYLIKWDGFSLDDATWEKQNHMNCPGLIEQFEKTPKILITKESLKCFRKMKKTPKKGSRKLRNPETPTTRKSSDFHFDKMISYGTIHTPIVKYTPQKINTPSFRTLDDSEVYLEPSKFVDVEDDESDEDTGDEFYEILHTDFVLPYEIQLRDLKVQEKVDKKRQHNSSTKPGQGRFAKGSLLDENGNSPEEKREEKMEKNENLDELELVQMELEDASLE